MESELLPCVMPDCESPMRRSMQGDTVYCSTCSYSSTPTRHNTLARRAEIGALVEEMCRNGSLDGPLKVFPSRLVDGPVRVSLATFAMGMRNGEAATLLDALRALAAELEPTDE